jgi:hypothetical protein
VRKLQFSKCSPTIFIKHVSDDEAEKVIKDLKGKLSAGIDKIPDYIVHKCIKFVKKSPPAICNASTESRWLS